MVSPGSPHLLPLSPSDATACDAQLVFGELSGGFSRRGTFLGERPARDIFRGQCPAELVWEFSRGIFRGRNIRGANFLERLFGPSEDTHAQTAFAPTELKLFHMSDWPF